MSTIGSDLGGESKAEQDVRCSSQWVKARKLELFTDILKELDPVEMPFRGCQSALPCVVNADILKAYYANAYIQLRMLERSDVDETV